MDITGLNILNFFVYAVVYKIKFLLKEVHLKIHSVEGQLQIQMVYLHHHELFPRRLIEFINSRFYWLLLGKKGLL